MHSTILDLIRGSLVVICHAISLYLLSDPKPGIKHPKALWTASAAVMEVIVFIISMFLGYYIQGMFLLYIALFVLLLGIFMGTAAGSAGKNLFLFLSYVSFFMLSVGISNLITTIFFNSDVLIQGFIRTLFSVCMMFIIRWPMRHFLKDTAYRIEKEWGTLAVFALTTTILSTFITLAGMFFIEDKKVLLALLIIFSLMILASIAIIIRMIALLVERQNLISSRYQREILENELKAEAEFVETARQHRHDQRHHDRIILELIESGKEKEAVEYLRNHEASLDEATLHSWCENTTLNALLRMTTRKCAELSIPFSASAVLPEKTSLPDIEIGVIFGNLLENAITATEKTTSPFLDITVKQTDNMVLADIRNRTNATPLFQNGLPVSLKANGGIGTKSVKSVVEKHGGIIRFTVKDDIFIAQVAFPL